MGKFRLTLTIISLLGLIFFSVGQGHSMSYFVDEGIKEKTDATVKSIEGVEKPEGEVKAGDFSQTSKYDETLAADSIFMGDHQENGEEIEVDLEEDSPEYLADKRKLFTEPANRLGAKPLRLTLEDCIRIALVNNNKVQATEYDIDGAKAQFMQAKARFYPVFEYEWLSAPVPSNVSRALQTFFKGDWRWWNKIRIGMGVPLYAFGKLNILKNIAEGGITAARERRKKERLSVVTRVRQLYYGVLLAEEMGDLLVKAHNKLSAEVEKKAKKDRSPVEKIKGRVFLVELENRLADARDKEILALEGLRVQLGLNPDVAVMVYSDKLRPIRIALRPLEAYIETALKSRPDVKLIEVGLETRRNQYKLEKRKWLPDGGIGAYLDLGRTVGTVVGITTTDDYSDPLNFSRAGIGMRLEGKFDVHGQIARVKKARSDYYKASLEHYMAKDGIGLEVKKAYMDAETSLGDVRRTDKAQSYARQLMFLTQSNFEIGIGDEEEYTNALQLVLLTRGRYFEAVFNYNVALAVLDEKAGIIPIIAPR